MQKISEPQYSCVSSTVCCDVCVIRHFCSVWALLCDLTGERYTCVKCRKTTREEWVKYCPFCGDKRTDITEDEI